MDEKEIKATTTSSMKCGKVCPVFWRPKPIKENSNKPKGVMIAVFGMSSGLKWICM